ncbi:MAG: hypothetical protein J0L83_13670 [Chitinophagales bacterium]|uniref:hypothetical protein n=1 Tax=Flavobacterium filum TaxID=370974 RepID=UPI001AC5606E|nr:hypothetical protein [Flavobacterium filum]MBN8665624.1 hypothetical protein [Chitinophagales bacterium]
MNYSTIELSFLGSLIMDRHFSTSKMGVNQKIFGTWRRHKLIPVQKNGKWTKANFVEIVWIRMLENMRRMNCSVATMKKAFYLFFQKAWENNLADNNRKVKIKYLQNYMKENGYTVENMYELQILQDIDENLDLKARLDFEVNYLYELLAQIILKGGEGGLKIDLNGDCEIYYIDSNKLSNVESLSLIHGPMITIPISHILAELLLDNYGIEFLYKHIFINEDEMRVIKELRNDNVASITVSKGEDDTLSISANEKGLITGEQARKIMQILGIKNYSSIELKTRNNSTLSFIKSNRV